MCYTYIIKFLEVVYLFNIGDKIVYPSQGVGVIDNIEQKEFNGEMNTYYNIHIINSTMKLMLPESRIDVSNIRLISNGNLIDETLNKIDEYIVEVDVNAEKNCKQRMIDNNLRFKSGTLKDYAEVISTLTKINQNHTLNSSEKQMLNNTKKIFIEEISSSKNISNLEASDILDDSLKIV